MPLLLHKNRGETPLQALDRLRREKPEYREATLSYAGRLDPMAEGAMLILVGEENKEREKYLALDKEYEVDILFGFATDSFDILGLITERGDIENLDREKVEKIIKGYEGTFLQPYPKYSSKSIAAGFEEKGLTPKEVTIYKVEIKGWREVKAEDLLQQIRDDVNKVKGDFRQDEIQARWREVLGSETGNFQVLKVKIACSSGTYMRVLAEKLGREAGSYAHAYVIRRLRIGSDYGTI